MKEEVSASLVSKFSFSLIVCEERLKFPWQRCHYALHRKMVNAL